MRLILISGLSMKKLIPVATVISVLLAAAVSGSLSGLEFCKIKEVKAETKSGYSFYDPVILFEIPNERQVGFYVDYYESVFVGSDVFLCGDVVYLMLKETRFRGGEFPSIANATLVASDDKGNVVWTFDAGPVGGGWSADPGSVGTGHYWRPTTIGNYTVGIIFEGLIYDVPNDFSDIIPLTVCRPGPFVGKVTSGDKMTGISNASVEALVDGVVKANAATNDEGDYTLLLEERGTYDIRVSASGYIPIIQRGFNAKIETQHFDFCLAPITQPPNFNVLWSANTGNSRNVAVDSQGNVIVASETKEGVTLVSKFDANGHLLWDISRRFSGAWEVPKGLAVDSSDNILLLIGPNQFLCYDLWTVKLDPDGDHVWMKMFDSNETDQSTDIAVDAFDNVIIIGEVDGDNSVLIKYTSDGGFLWSKTLHVYATGEIVVDSGNNIIVGGSSQSNPTGTDYYIAKLDAQGNLLWEKTVNDTRNEYDRCSGITLDSNENIIAIGNPFTVKLDSNGSEVWLRYLQGEDLVVDLYENIFSVRESSLEMFDRNGLFLGDIELTEDLSTIAIYGNSTLIVGGAQNVIKINVGENTTTQLNDHTTQPKTQANSDVNTYSPTNSSEPISSEPTPMLNPEPTFSPPQLPESNSEPYQEVATTPETQQANNAPPVSAFALIASIAAVSTVSPIYFKKHKR